MPAWLIAVTLLAAADLDCEHAQSMKHQRLCGDDARQAETAMQDAYESAMRRLEQAPHGNDRDLLAASQKAWNAYRKSFCEAISAHWGNGSIRDQYYVECMKKHSLSRRQEIDEYISRPPGDARPADEQN